MSPAWYEYQPEAIVKTAGDYSSAVIPTVTLTAVERVTNPTTDNHSNYRDLPISLLRVHLLHKNKDTLQQPLLPHERPCYCCKGTDYWLAGTEKYPRWVCRKCHPPAPGAERKPVKT